MSVPELNVERLRGTLQRIEDNPSEWNQSTWRCGTQMCFAGHACNEAGAEWDEDFVVSTRVRNEQEGQAEWQPIPDRAREVLGLTDQEANVMFAGGNTIDDLRLMVEWIITRRREEQPITIVEFAERANYDREKTINLRRRFPSYLMRDDLRPRPAPSANLHFDPWTLLSNAPSAFELGPVLEVGPPTNVISATTRPWRVERPEYSPMILQDIDSGFMSFGAVVERPGAKQPETVHELDETDRQFYDAIYDTRPDDERLPNQEGDGESTDSEPVLVVPPDAEFDSQIGELQASIQRLRESLR